jgi:hypothetical protein
MIAALNPCPGCGAQTPYLDGPTHEYIGASAGCWEAYGRLLAKEYGDFRYMKFHHSSIDAYCCQHPREPSPKSIRSVAVRLVGLHLELKTDLPHEKLYAARKRISTLDKSGDQTLHCLEPPASPEWITVLDVLETTSLDEHAILVSEWATSVWSAWTDHHETIRRWADVTA